MSKSPWLWLARLALGLVAAFAIWLGYLYWGTRPLAFERVVWDANADNWNDDHNRRHRMADWLIKKGRLSGLTRAEAVALLGEPPATNYFRDYDLVYNLGSERGFVGIDSEWLLLTLDTQGRVDGIRQATD